MVPTIGSVYTVTITKDDNSTVTYTRTLISTPGVSRLATDFPNFTVITTHAASKVINTTLTGSVYLPTWITEIQLPWVWSAGAGAEVEALFTGAATTLGQSNAFSVAIPGTYTLPVLTGHAGAYGIKGGGQTIVNWYFE